jgi:hypothetical protein
VKPSPIPRSLFDRTPGSVAFLGRVLVQLDDPRSVIPADHVTAVRRFAVAAMSGLVPPLAAAAAITKAHEDTQIAQMACEPGLVAGVERFSLREARSRIDDRLGVLERFESAHALESLEIVEIELTRDTHVTMISNAYLEGSSPTRAFYDAYIHPPGSCTWRYLPLQLLVFAALEAASETPVDIELTADELSLDDVRDLLARPHPARPLCVSCVPFQEGGFAVHGGLIDGYQMTLHDLTHAIVLRARPSARASEAVALYDALSSAVREDPPSSEARGPLDDVLDHLISGYDAPAAALAHVEARLAALAPMVGATRARRYAEALRRCA